MIVDARWDSAWAWLFSDLGIYRMLYSLNGLNNCLVLDKHVIMNDSLVFKKSCVTWLTVSSESLWMVIHSAHTCLLAEGPYKGFVFCLVVGCLELEAYHIFNWNIVRVYEDKADTTSFLIGRFVNMKCPLKGRWCDGSFGFIVVCDETCWGLSSEMKSTTA